MKKYLVYLSGDYLDLAFEELKASLEAEKINYFNIRLNSQIAVFESQNSPLIAVKRCAYSHFLVELCFIGEIENNRLNIQVLTLPELEEKKSIRVRINKIGKKKTSFSTSKMEKTIAKEIYEHYQNHDFEVNLINSDYTFRGICVENKLYVGFELHIQDKKEIVKREPGKRPVFRPGAMKVKFSRSLVNLCRVKRDSIFYDPFCGGGGLLLESTLLGAYSIGSDLDYRAIECSKINLKAYVQKKYELIVTDSRKLPIIHADAIATDPPYSIQSSTHGEEILSLLSKFLKEAQNILKKGSYCVFCSPKKNQPEKIIDYFPSFNLKTMIDTRIHGSLTRRIIVLVKNSD
ncbi:MAG: THUMP domain-containing protein [Candidatus Heimdallarchaeaceae archaeon]